MKERKNASGSFFLQRGKENFFLNLGTEKERGKKGKTCSCTRIRRDVTAAAFDESSRAGETRNPGRHTTWLGEAVRSCEREREKKGGKKKIKKKK